MHNPTAKAGALVAGLLLLAACGTNKTEVGAAGQGNGCDTSKGSLIIGLIAPLSGGQSSIGLGIRNAAALAVDQANEKCTVKGYRLVLQPEDDTATPQIGIQAASKLAATDGLVCVLGTYNSSVAQSVQPVLAAKNIVQISPGNTNPSLTTGPDPANPKRQFNNYFRTVTTDAYQGPYAADHLVKKLGKKSIAIIDDGKTYGVGLTTEFIKQATKLGAKIVAKERVSEKDTDFNGVLAKVKAAKPDAIYVGSEYPVAAPLSKQAGEAGLKAPVMGGDGIFDDKYIALGGRPGDLATSVGAPTDSQPSAKAFVDAYNAKKYADGYGGFGAFSYDAANAIITSLANTLGPNGTWSESQRGALRDQVQSYKGSGATGEVAFDQYGDSTNKVLTVYEVDNGKWAVKESGTYTGS
ncbi:branched-chain amino acid ABC transporter substrate-binding protein [Kibdelosporangium philippinense]|uniref:Branched-chain amino acid ABC transporter substrate-binding protein n=1 Tax=Kibdelosporangium philippinense TaxID=211113 RepID=A0ABS8ZHS6_9PSEU|nr:branched-chain amino acid ABC transporter substrate-binding protein [Kibdelosporangium philippinense]MCE7006475.1 branched-chain amino acid ABC transporter substrate-binding protein [Kibdelosporangium philippinense]